MKKSPNEQISLDLTLDRLSKRINELQNYIFGDVESLLPIQYKQTPGTILSPPQIPLGGWQILEEKLIPIGDPECKILWFRRRFEMPYGSKQKRICLYLWFGNIFETGYLETVEGMVYIDGVAFQGIDWNHREVLLPADIDLDMEHELTIRVNFEPHHLHRRIINLELREIRMPIFRTFHRLQCMLDAVNVMDRNALATRKFIELIDSMIRRIPFTDPGSQEFLKAIEEIDKNFSIPDDFGEKIRPTVSLVGNSHIDVAWLWDIESTKRKTISTFSTICRLMEEYPNFTYIQSQPQLYEFVRESEPELFERIQQYARQGRWEAEGSTWVEPDMNIPSGEAIIRQFLYGKRYFQKYFEHDCRLLWLPDTFGFNANLPQIMKKCAVDYFVTSKISWNTYSRFPYDTFRWVGIDGSEVLAHFLTAPNKDFSFWAQLHGKMSPFEIKGNWDYFSEKDTVNEVLHTYGFGDGGGGPTREMLERLPIISQMPQMPNAIPGRVIEFFNRLESTRSKLLKWVGELYLEYHRGTLTSRGEIKSLNRKTECALNYLEKAFSLGITYGKRPFDEEDKYRLDELWKRLLQNHFHDIIAGTCIHPVNKLAVESLRDIESEARRLADQIMNEMYVFGDEDFAVFNPHTFPVKEIIKFEIGNEMSSLTESLFKPENSFSVLKQCNSIIDHKGNLHPIQIEKRSLYFPIELPPLSAGGFKLSAKSQKKKYEKVSVVGKLARTPFFDAQLDDYGRIVSLLDKRTDPPRQLIIPGEKANNLRFFEDRPLNWDAWDIDEYYREFPLEELETYEKASFSEKGPLVAIFRTHLKFRNSTIRQAIFFYAHTPRIDFQTIIDWKEKNVLLKAEFPLNVNSNEVYYEIPFGYTKRPSHSNRPHDRAAFEVPGQRWAAIFENGYGAAILNDSRYGYSAYGSTLGLTLLKSAVYPDPDGEQGQHNIIYSLLPCLGSQPTAEIIRSASIVNAPLKIIKQCDLEIGNDPTMYDSFFKGRNSAPKPEWILPNSFSVSSDENHVILETIKPAEDGNGIILRMYEALNRRGEATLKLPAKAKSAWEVDMLENADVGNWTSDTRSQIPGAGKTDYRRGLPTPNESDSEGLQPLRKDNYETVRNTGHNSHKLKITGEKDKEIKLYFMPFEIKSIRIEF